METGETVRVFFDDEDKVTCVAVTPDGKAALSGSETGYLKLWDLDSGQCLKVFDRHPACWDMRDMRGLIRASNREFAYNDAIGNLAMAQTFDLGDPHFLRPCGCGDGSGRFAVRSLCHFR